MPKPKQSSKKTKARSIGDLPPAKRPSVNGGTSAEATGLVTVFRTGRLTHCISTKVQCSAKAYSVSP